jgi:hypothetical protein
MKRWRIHRGSGRSQRGQMGIDGDNGEMDLEMNVECST